MSDLRSRLRGLDSLEAPDVWERATKLDPRGPDPEPASERASRRIVAGVVALAVFVAAGAFAWTAFRPDRTQGVIPSTPNSVDGTILWPERTGSDLSSVQLRADDGDAAVAWRLDPQQVAVRFAVDVLGWGTPEGRYAVTSVPDTPSPGIAEFSLERYAIPCPSPAPGADTIDCPPPFERQFVVLGQKATVGEGGVWSVTQAQATHIKLNVEPGDQLLEGAQIDGTLDVAPTNPPSIARAGVQVGTEGDCFIGTSQPRSTDFALAVRFPEGTSCGSQPGYAWLASEPSGQGEGLTNPDPLSSTPGVQRTLYGLTAVPFLVAAHPSETATPTASSATSPPTSGAPGTEGAPTSSVVLADGTLRCTAVFHTGTVDPGSQVGVTFHETNISGAPVDVAIGENGAAGWLLISSGGQQVSDTSLAHSGISGPAPTQKSVAPEDSVSIETRDIPVLWPGPLEVTPVCEGQAMPPVTLETATTQAPSSPAEAVDRAVADTDGFFTNCPPKADGSWTQGSVPGSGGSTLDTRCGAWVQENPDFDLVVLAAVAPPDAPELDLSTLPAAIQAVPMGVVPKGMGVRWWVYVVTATDAQHAGGRTVVVCPNSMSFGSGLTDCGH